MKEKGIDELFTAMRRLHSELGDRVILDLVGFFGDDYEEEVNNLVAEGVAVFRGFQSDPAPIRPEPTAWFCQATTRE